MYFRARSPNALSASWVLCYTNYERFRWLGGDADVLASGGYGRPWPPLVFFHF